jgi:hypothetical protein
MWFCLFENTSITWLTISPIQLVFTQNNPYDQKCEHSHKGSITSTAC